jgi:hypothetical protein
MLIRVRGYVDGVAAYLRNGQKSGRENHRDDLDERVILAGDLELTDKIIQSIDSGGERYKTITLSFKEDMVSVEVLNAIVADFKDFAFAAYRDDEFNFYAEAHLPKIKSYIDRLKGERIERMPHIHIVVPKVNLLTGKYAEPFGYFELSEKYIAAFQEHINYKYNLASPQDNRRTMFTDTSEFISRYKGDDFKGKNKRFLTEIREAMIQCDIVTVEGFRKMVSAYGAISFGKKGMPDEYLKVTFPGQSKAIRFDHDHFRRAFIELRSDEKRQFLTLEKHKLSPDAQGRFLTLEKRGLFKDIVPPRIKPEECAVLMREWRELRAKEVKYINSGYRSFYKSYQAMSGSEKIAELHARELRFYEKYQGEGDFEKFVGVAKANGSAIFGSHITFKTERQERDVLQVKNRSEAGRGEAYSQRQRTTDSVLGQFGVDVIDRQHDAKAHTLTEFNEIKLRLEAGRLLALLSKSHGVDPEKYLVVRGKDGGERIRAGGNNWNVSDFLTKQMHLSWKDASQILRNCYAAQIAGVLMQVQRSPSRDLWASYQNWKRGVSSQRRSEAMAAIRGECRTSISAAAQRFSIERGRIEGMQSTQAEKKRLIDIAKAYRVHAQKEARDKAVVEQEEERFAWKGDELYKRYLEETVQDRGPLAEAALCELRKRQLDLPEADAEDAIIRADRSQLSTAEPIVRSLTYRVDRAGHIIYCIAGRDALKDEGKSVRVLQASDTNVIEEGLRLAQAKFGKRITLHGSDEFKRRAVAIVVEKNMQIEFSDPILQRLKNELGYAKTERLRLAAYARQSIQAKRATDDDGRNKDVGTSLVFSKAAIQPGINVAGILTPAVTISEAPQNIPAPQLSVIVGSMLPSKPYGRYAGAIVSHDENFVYQQVGREVVRHKREQFKELPGLGVNVSIRYRAGNVQSVHNANRSRGR